MLALGALTSGSAEAWTLDALLRLPMERLMELRVTAQRTAQETSEIAPCAGADLGEGVDRAA